MRSPTARIALGTGLAWLGVLTVSRALVVVEGWSMTPALAPGDRLLTLPLPRSLDHLRRTLLRPGTIVVISRDAVVVGDPGTANGTVVTGVGPHEHLDVKRVRRVGPDGIWVEGDHPTRSIDSRTYGTLPFDRVRAIAIARWPGLWRRP